MDTIRLDTKARRAGRVGSSEYHTPRRAELRRLPGLRGLAATVTAATCAAAAIATASRAAAAVDAAVATAAAAAVAAALLAAALAAASIVAAVATAIASAAIIAIAIATAASSGDWRAGRRCGRPAGSRPVALLPRSARSRAQGARLAFDSACLRASETRRTVGCCGRASARAIRARRTSRSDELRASVLLENYSRHKTRKGTDRTTRLGRHTSRYAALSLSSRYQLLAVRYSTHCTFALLINVVVKAAADREHARFGDEPVERRAGRLPVDHARVGRVIDARRRPELHRRCGRIGLREEEALAHPRAVGLVGLVRLARANALEPLNLRRRRLARLLGQIERAALLGQQHPLQRREVGGEALGEGRVHRPPSAGPRARAPSRS